MAFECTHDMDWLSLSLSRLGWKLAQIQREVSLLGRLRAEGASMPCRHLDVDGRSNWKFAMSAPLLFDSFEF